MASQLTSFSKQLLGIYLSIWIFPIRLVFLACFVTFGVLLSAGIEIIAVFRNISDVSQRRKHYSSGNIQSSNKGTLEYGMSDLLSNTLPRASKTLSKNVDRHLRHASAQHFIP